MNKNYYYDFAIMKNNELYCFIEYDGILHFQQNDYHGWNNKENWEKTHTNYIIKNKYCEEFNIPLIRIPYIDFDKINILYLLERIDSCV